MPQTPGIALGGLLAGILLLGASNALAATVGILTSGGEAFYGEAVAGLRDTLPEDVRTVTRTVARDGLADDTDIEYVVSVGTEALRRALREHRRVPVLALLVPRRAFESLTADVGGRGASVAALYLDQPLERQIRVARALFPSLERFGVVLAETSAPADFASAGAPLNGLEVEYRRSAEPPLRAVTRLGDRVDAIIGVPDSRLYNSRSIHGILLASYRANVPLIGYSRSVVRAGGLASAWLSPRAHGSEAGRILAPYLNGDRDAWPESGYSRRFRIAVNERVARSLGLQPTFEPADRVFREGDPIE